MSYRGGGEVKIASRPSLPLCITEPLSQSNRSITKPYSFKKVSSPQEVLRLGVPLCKAVLFPFKARDEAQLVFVSFPFASSRVRTRLKAEIPTGKQAAKLIKETESQMKPGEARRCSEISWTARGARKERFKASRFTPDLQHGLPRGSGHGLA